MRFCGCPEPLPGPATDKSGNRSTFFVFPLSMPSFLSLARRDSLELEKKHQERGAVMRIEVSVDLFDSISNSSI